MPASDVDPVFPSNAALRHCLTRLFKTRGATASDVVIVEREPLAVGRTDPGERVVCVVDGRREHLCCNYGGHSDAAHERYGHRDGTAY